MKASLRRIGAHDSPLLIVDDFSGKVAAIVEMAAALAPFPPPATGYYPGLRRVIEESDAAAWDYVQRAMRAAAPLIGGAFDAAGFGLVEASFSLVTQPANTLGAIQRMPHFDSTDPDYIAVLHYLGGTAGTGTAFYRQRSTGIERVDETNLATFVRTARAEGAASEGYVAGATGLFAEVAAVEARPDRLIIYQGALLHSGIIPPALPLSPDPRVGRLTANFFVRANRA